MSWTCSFLLKKEELITLKKFWSLGRPLKFEWRIYLGSVTNVSIDR